jgi:hypothetical protein
MLNFTRALSELPRLACLVGLVTTLSLRTNHAIALQSTITEAEGNACRGAHRSRTETEHMALAEAKRNAGEFAATMIENKTEDEDLGLKQDLVTAFSKASVEILKVLRQEWYKESAGGNCYRIRIQAEVIPDRKTMEKTESKQAQRDDPSLPLKVKLWAGRTVYRRGDVVRVYLKGNKPFYAQLVYQNSEGDLIQLLPNPYRDENYFHGGVTYEVPSGKDRFELTVIPPFGEETIILYGSTAPLGEIELEESGPVYTVITPADQVSRSLRGLRIEKKSKAPAAEQAAAEFDEAHYKITISR